ncbi:MAG: hypothetical protein AB9869_15700 [Verrucomicrobiia bacterium]
MSASSMTSTAGDTLLDADPQFNVMALYADRETGHRTREIHDRGWRLDLLSDAQCGTLAAKEAVDAKMLILSIHRGDDLPFTVERWLETVLEQKQDSLRAPVVLVDRNEADSLSNPNSIYAHLPDAARRAHPSSESSWLLA